MKKTVFFMATLNSTEKIVIITIRISLRMLSLEGKLFNFRSNKHFENNNFHISRTLITVQYIFPRKIRFILCEKLNPTCKPHHFFSHSKPTLSLIQHNWITRVDSSHCTCSFMHSTAGAFNRKLPLASANNFPSPYTKLHESLANNVNFFSV